jgi:lipopolysaccharide/colanic/teichoic acid biosynthesis glycosyltransferase
VLESQEPEQVVADWSRRFRMERHYIANQSVAYDLVVIGLTVRPHPAHGGWGAAAGVAVASAGG